MDGFITIHRKIREWEWYKIPNTKDTFLEILLTANIRDIKYRGHLILRGHLLTTMEELAFNTGLTKDEVRTALKNLKSSHTISHTKAHNKLLINVLNYDDYQLGGEKEPTQLPTQSHADIPHGSHTVPTPYIEGEGKEGEEKDTVRVDVPKKPKRAKAAFVPPTLDDIREYCNQRGNGVNPQKFFDFYTSDPDPKKHWVDSRGNPVRNWKQKVITWETDGRKMAPKPAAPKQTDLDFLLEGSGQRG